MNEDETKAIAEILDELGTTSNVQVRSSHELAAEVNKAAADEDKKRAEDGRGPLRRRTDYRAIALTGQYVEGPRSLLRGPSTYAASA
ncbi:hypothetical protein ACF08M_28825 [Streptomyces sp. NPDC015032]|uniref:hypothetical protein n=1 Tax=Streptomyces sp. NPDC015032 TaxID=3364937 RepID=UPI0037012485